MSGFDIRLSHVNNSVEEIKTVLRGLSPQIHQMHTVVNQVLPTLATKGELTAEVSGKVGWMALIGVLALLVAVAFGAYQVGSD